jgi:glutathione S-transferase
MTPNAPLILYYFPLSGHSHRAQLLLSLAHLPHELVPVDLASGAHKRPEFLRKNPFGLVPVLEHGDFVLSDSNAILLYLAETFPSAAPYWPSDARSRGLIQRWLSVSAGPLYRGPCAARIARVFGRPLDHAEATAIAQSLFAVMEQELSTRSFLVGSSPTLADLAMYTYTAHAPEGDISLGPYPNIRAWVARIQALPHFVPMPSAPRRG